MYAYDNKDKGGFIFLYGYEGTEKLLFEKHCQLH